MSHSNTSLLHNSFVPKFQAWGHDTVQEISHVTSPYVHAVEQPVANAYHETRTQLRSIHSWTGTLFGVAAFWGAGWLAWTMMGEIFPSERNSVSYAVRSIGKRLRLH